MVRVILNLLYILAIIDPDHPKIFYCQKILPPKIFADYTIHIYMYVHVCTCMYSILSHSGTAFYKRFQHWYTRICNYFAQSPENIAPFADALRSRGLITEATAGSVKFPDGTGPYDKATKMLNPLLHSLQYHPDHRDELVGALRECGLHVVIGILERYTYACVFVGVAVSKSTNLNRAPASVEINLRPMMTA